MPQRVLVLQGECERTLENRYFNASGLVPAVRELLFLVCGSGLWKEKWQKNFHVNFFALVFQITRTLKPFISAFCCLLGSS